MKKGIFILMFFSLVAYSSPFRMSSVLNQSLDKLIKLCHIKKCYLVDTYPYFPYEKKDAEQFVKDVFKMKDNAVFPCDLSKPYYDKTIVIKANLDVIVEGLLENIEIVGEDFVQCVNMPFNNKKNKPKIMTVEIYNVFWVNDNTYVLSIDFRVSDKYYLRYVNQSRELVLPENTDLYLGVFLFKKDAKGELKLEKFKILKEDMDG